jgi:hypothetical protein
MGPAPADPDRPDVKHLGQDRATQRVGRYPGQGGVEFGLGGAPRRTLGTSGESGEDEKHFFQPTDVAIGPNGTIYVADGYGNNRVAAFNANGRFLFAWGKKGAAPGEFNIPHNILCDEDGRVYVADRANNRIQRFAADGEWQAEAALPGNAFCLAWEPDGRLLATCVQGDEWHGLLWFDRCLRPLSRYGQFGTGPGEFKIPHGIARDPLTGELAVGTVGDKRIQFLKT